MIRILIIDDQKSVRENIKLILKSTPNLEVVGVAENGHQGIKLAEVLEPDVILMDLQMPKLDGLAATKLITQKNPHLNVIILTIQDRDKLLIQALNAGARGYLLKSTAPEEIINTINLVYEGNNFTKHKQRRVDTILESENNHHREQFAISEIANTQKVLVENDLNSQTTSQQSPQWRSRLNLSTLLSILKHRYPPALMGFCGVLLGAVLYLTFAKKTYQATASMMLQDRQESISELGRDLSSISGSNEYSPLASQVELIKSKSVLSDALKNIAQEEKDDSLDNISPSKIRENLTVSIIPNTNIIRVSYTNSDPELASVILNEIINTVRNRNIESIRSQASSVRQFLEKEVDKQKKEVAKTETAENLYRKQEGLVAIDSQTTNLVNSLNNLETQQQDLLTQIKEREAKLNNLQQLTNLNDAKSAYIEGKVGQDRQLEQLRTQLTAVETELAAASSNLTDNHPTLIALKEKRAEILALYQQRVRAVLGKEEIVSPAEITSQGSGQTQDGLSQEVLSELITNQIQLEANKDKLKAIQIEKNKIQQQIASLPAKAQSLAELVRLREQANESLQFLQRKLEEAKIAEAQLVGNFQIVEGANTPSSPNSPKTLVVLAIALVIATILMIAIVLLLEKIDRTLYDSTEVETKLQIPFLTSLPDLDLQEESLSRIQIRSFLSNQNLYEPYRFLFKRLESQHQEQLKIIVVTSAIAGEGKSIVASHLGIVSAMLSKRTLIVDAHFNSPKQYSLFDVKPQPGLREAAIYGWSLAKVVQPTKIENLSVLASGIQTSDSWLALESPEIKNLLQEAATQYDLIVVDTPPVSSSCDAYTLSKHSSGLIMVTRPFHTPKDVLEQTVVDLKRNNTPITGFVVNNANQQNRRSDRDLQDNGELPLLPDSEPTKNSRKHPEEITQP